MARDARRARRQRAEGASELLPADDHRDGGGAVRGARRRRRTARAGARARTRSSSGFERSPARYLVRSRAERAPRCGSTVPARPDRPRRTARSSATTPKRRSTKAGLSDAGTQARPRAATGTASSATARASSRSRSSRASAASPTPRWSRRCAARRSRIFSRPETCPAHADSTIGGRDEVGSQISQLARAQLDVRPRRSPAVSVQDPHHHRALRAAAAPTRWRACSRRRSPRASASR